MTSNGSPVVLRFAERSGAEPVTSLESPGIGAGGGVTVVAAGKPEIGRAAPKGKTGFGEERNCTSAVCLSASDQRNPELEVFNVTLPLRVLVRFTMR